MTTFAWWPALLSMPVAVALSGICLTMLIAMRCIDWRQSNVVLQRTIRDLCIVKKCLQFLIGVIVACVYSNWIGHQYIFARDSINYQTAIWVQGDVLSIQNQSNNDSDKYAVLFNATQIDSQAVAPRILRLNWYYPTDYIKQGQQWRLLVKLKPARGLANRAGFDYQRYLIGRHIVATGYIKKHPNNQPLTVSTTLVQHMSQQLYESEFINKNWINALLFGHKGDLAYADKQRSIATGTAHLFVISGLHVGIVATWFWFFAMRLMSLCGVCTRFFHYSIDRFIRPLSVLFMLSLTWGYCALLGFSIPMLRAFTIMCIVAVISSLHMHCRPIHKLLLCCTVVMLIFPFSGFNTGFWLSFVAVAQIIFITHTVRFATTGFRAKSVSFLRLQSWLTLALIPINIAVFNHIYPASILANLWAIPWVTLVIVPLCLCVIGYWCVQVLLIGIQSEFDLVLHTLLRLIDLCFSSMFAGIDVLHQPSFISPIFSPVALSISTISMIGLLLVNAGLLVFHRQTQQQVTLLLLLIGSYGIGRQFIQHSQTEVQLEVLDVGQGSAALLMTKGSALVFDVGDDYGERFNMVNSVIKPTLQHASIKQLDNVFISHPDKDHSGGLARLVKSYPNMQVITNSELCTQGYQQYWHGIDITVLWPPKQWQHPSSNEQSCVIKLTYAGVQVLLTGDIEQFAEWQLQIAHRRGEIDLHSDILIVPHHGSLSSSSEAFLQQINPRIAIISSGFMNRYQLPHPKVVKRYQSLGIPVLNTATVGSVSVLLSTDFTTQPMQASISTRRASPYQPWSEARWYHF